MIPVPTSELEVPVQPAVVIGLEHCLHGGMQAVGALDERGEDKLKALVVVLGQHKQCLGLAWSGIGDNGRLEEKSTTWSLLHRKQGSFMSKLVGCKNTDSVQRNRQRAASVVPRKNSTILSRHQHELMALVWCVANMCARGACLTAKQNKQPGYMTATSHTPQANNLEVNLSTAM